MRYSLDNFVKNSALESENVSLKADRDGLLTKVKELETKLSDADKTTAAFPLAKQTWESDMNKIKTEHEKALDTLKNEHQTKIDGVTAELANAKTTLNKEVIASLTSVGIQAGQVKEEKAEGEHKVETPILNPRFKITPITP